MKSLIAIRHIQFEHLDTFENLCRDNGFEIKYLDAGVHDPQELLDADLAVVLGGPLGAGDEEEYPFLLDELKVIEARLKQARPLLGICLGSQLIARALGATLHFGSANELGWLPIALTEAGKSTSLRHFGNGELVFQWHSDTFDLPAGAVQLARSTVCENQAFSYGDTTLALQFHPEVSASNLESWYIGNSRALQADADKTASQLRGEARLHSAGLQQRSEQFLMDWLKQIELLD